MLGDNDKLYIPVDVAQIYKDVLVQYADILLPNQTECEFLTGIKLSDEAAAIIAMDYLHSKGTKTVIITSSEFAHSPGKLFVLGSTRSNGATGMPNKSNHTYFFVDRWKIPVTKIPGYFSGTGDMFGALMVAWTAQGFSAKYSCLRCVCTILV